jgi:hypothetical protein
MEKMHESSPKDDIFARLRAMSLLRDDDSPAVDTTNLEAKAVGALPEKASGSEAYEKADRGGGLDAPENSDSVAAESASVGRSGAEPPKKQVEEEESIDDYMARLLNRVRGNSEDEPAKTVKSESQPAVPAPSTRHVEQDQPVSDEADEVVEMPTGPKEPVQLVARSVARESSLSLAAMRELANDTARGAIDKHSHGKGSVAVVQRFVGAGISTCGGAALFYFGHTSYPPLQWAGLACMVAATVCVWQGSKLSLSIRSIGRRTDKFTAAQSHPGRSASGGQKRTEEAASESDA